METWVKLYRKIEQWEWYQDANTFRLFIHCLIKANYNGNKWQGEILPRGSFPTSPEKLGAELGLSRQQIRTSINKLKSTNEITTKSTNKFTIINIVNYSIYQDEILNINQQNNQQINKPITINQPTNNQQITTLKEVKKEKIKESKEINIVQNSNFDFFWSLYPRKESKVKAEIVWKKINPDESLFNDIIQGLERYKVCEKVKAGFIQLPTTWLNGREWESIYETKKNNSSKDALANSILGGKNDKKTIYGSDDTIDGNIY